MISDSNMKKKIKKLIKKILGIKNPNINTRKYWNEIWTKEGLNTRNNTILHKKIIDIVQANQVVLDVGCGNGQISRKLISEKSCECYGLDFSDKILDELKKHNIKTVYSHLPEIPCKDEFFDSVICIETLEHLDKPYETLGQMYRVLKPEGLILFSVPDGCLWEARGEHVHAFTPNDCIAMLRPLVKEVNLCTLKDSSGWPFFLCWGYKKENENENS